MDKAEKLATLLMTVFFSVSSFFIFLSQERSASASDLLLESVISYENEKILSDGDLRLLIATNMQLTNRVSKQNLINYACLIGILGDKMTPYNQTMHQNFLDSCINITMDEIDFPQTYANTSKPLTEYMEKINKVYDLRKESIKWKYLGIAFFFIAILCFFFLVEMKAIEYYLKKVYARKNE